MADFPDQENELFKSLKPAVVKLDAQVKLTQESQKDLLQVINSVSEELRRIGELQHVDVEIEAYLKRLLNAKRRILAVDNTSKNILERLNRLTRKVQKDPPS